MVNITPRRLYLWERTPYPLNMGINGPQRWSVHFEENLLPLPGFEPRKSRTTLFSIRITLYRLPNDDDVGDDHDDSTSESILLIINPCHDNSWGSGQGMKGFRPDLVVPGSVRIYYTHTSKTAKKKKKKKSLRFELKAIIIKHRIKKYACRHKCTGDVYGKRSLCPKQHCSALRRQILMTKHSWTLSGFGNI